MLVLFFFNSIFFACDHPQYSIRQLCSILFPTPVLLLGDSFFWCRLGEKCFIHTFDNSQKQVHCLDLLSCHLVTIRHSHSCILLYTSSDWLVFILPSPQKHNCVQMPFTSRTSCWQNFSVYLCLPTCVSCYSCAENHLTHWESILITPWILSHCSLI